MRINDKRVLQYIKDEKEKGFSDEEILNVMVQNGYDEQKVRETLTYLKDSKGKTSDNKRENNERDPLNLGEVPDGRFSRSWYLTKACFKIMWNRPVLFWYPITAQLLSIIFILALIVPWIVAEGLSGIAAASAFIIGVLFIIYLGLAFISSFFFSSSIYITKNAIEGKEKGYLDGIAFSFKRFFRILQWSFLSALVGVLLKVMESVGRKMGPIGKIVVGLLRRLLGLAWKVISWFAIPALVIYDIGPIDSIKKSAQVLKKTWGENLAFAIGLNLTKYTIGFLIVLSHIGFGVLAGFYFGMTGNILIHGFFLMLYIAEYTFFKTARYIFNTAVFMYAANNTLTPWFPDELVKGALKAEE